MTMDDDVARRLSAAYAQGTSDALKRWAATGRPGVLLLREFFDETWDPAPAPGVFSRDLVDNTSALIAEIAAAQPEAFLETFESKRYRDNSLVLTGLGQIDDERATRRLARVAGSVDQWVRMQVAIELGRRASSVATATLVRLLGDDEYLVRYHALRSLATVGDVSALAALREHEPDSQHERELAEQAVRSIEERAGR